MSDQRSNMGQGSPQNFEGDFSSLSDRAIAYAQSINHRSVVFYVNAEQFEIVPARPGYIFVVTDLILVAHGDLSGLTGGLFSLSDGLSLLQVFNWEDYISDLREPGQVVRIQLAGVAGHATANGSPLYIYSGDVTISVATAIVDGVWIEAI